MTTPAVAQSKFVAIVLAGDRHAQDPVAMDAGVSCKAITPIAGKAMIMRVIDALEASPYIDRIILCGPPETSLEDCPELKQRIAESNIDWLKNEDSPSRSTESALREIKGTEAVLLTTADHALLTRDIVDAFLENSIESNADANVALVSHKTILDAYPEVKRTVLKFKPDGYCSCNLFVFNNRNGQGLVPFWRKLEQERKKPAKIVIGVLGIGGLLSYLVGSLHYLKAFSKVSRRLDISITPIILRQAEAGVDVDTPADRVFAESLLLKMKEAP